MSSNRYVKLHIQMHIFSDICLREMTCNNLNLTHKLYMKWFRTENKEYIPLTTYKYLTQHHITSIILNTNQIYNSIEMGNQHMETSHTIAWKCGHCASEFRMN